MLDMKHEVREVRQKMWDISCETGDKRQEMGDTKREVREVRQKMWDICCETGDRRQ